jgi:hypothetical protein
MDKIDIELIKARLDRNLPALIAKVGDHDPATDLEDHIELRQRVKNIMKERVKLQSQLSATKFNNPEEDRFFDQLLEKNDSFGSDFDLVEDDLAQNRRKRAGTGEMQSKFKFPEPLFPNLINIGNVQGLSKLD